MSAPLTITIGWNLLFLKRLISSVGLVRPAIVEDLWIFALVLLSVADVYKSAFVEQILIISGSKMWICSVFRLFGERE